MGVVGGVHCGDLSPSVPILNVGIVGFSISVSGI